MARRASMARSRSVVMARTVRARFRVSRHAAERSSCSSLVLVVAMARILVTGATGSLGRRVAARAVADGHVVLGTHLRPRTVTAGARDDVGDWVRLDICDLDAVREVVGAFRPDVVVHTAAGRDRNDWAPTARGAANVALACVGLADTMRDDVSDRGRFAAGAAGRGEGGGGEGRGEAGGESRDDVGDRGPFAAGGGGGERRSEVGGEGHKGVGGGPATGRVRLVHVSSDAIFSGRAGREYTESDEPDPIYPYGAAKAAAETAVRAIDPFAAVVRTSLILGDGNGAHEHLTHDLVAGRVDGALFVDETRKPVHVDDLAAALLELGLGNFAGVINVAGVDAVSRYELGVLVARRDGLDADRIPSATSSGRPGDIRLDVTLATQLLRTRLRGAHEFMQEKP
ncbi:MAG TPA: sugar nucleotide-binding protein [Dactylosporangium sp.]|nr:sugar nucleotide-binding protein [Dactylosporangium sp.]